MKKASVIGLFCTGQTVADGQSVKTRIVTQELEKALGVEQVCRVDTYGWKKNPVKLLINCFKAVCTSSNVVFLTDEGGIKVFPWLLRCINIFHRRRIHYVVIGGWLVPFLKKHALLRACLKKLDNIYAETTEMRKGLESAGFSNVSLLPNSKNLTPLKEEQLVFSYQAPYPFCTFSRVMREKGIADAVDAIKTVNAQFGRAVCTLDIYGQVDPGQTTWFEDLQKAFPAEVRYCGVINYDQSVEVLKDYFALLFPTEFFTEGVPGTIIDAYAAGVPVVAARWESFTDVVDDGITGIGYPFGKQDCLAEVIMSIVDHPELVNGMKINCLQKAEQYLPDNVMDILFSRLS